MQTSVPDYKYKITTLQLSTIIICFLMNMLDGMDVMVISYSASSISKEWTIAPAQFGLVFSIGLLGMAMGAMFLAPRADIIGRRAMILISAAIMGICVWITVLAQSIEQLIFIRFFSGLGIGCLLASTATLTAEYAPVKTKDFWVSFVMSGYPIGAIFSGLVASEIIPNSGWRMLFQVAGIVTLITLPVIYFFLSESLEFLLKSQPTNALKRVNAILKKINLTPLTELPEIEKVLNTKEKALSDGFLASFVMRPLSDNPTFYLWSAFFMSFATLYFLTSWIPKLASASGLSIQLAIFAGTVFNLGAFFGIVTQGYLSSKFGLKRVIFYFLLSTAFFMILFGFFKGSLSILILLGLIGFGIQGGFVGLYSVAARLYPTKVRSTGVGWSIGVGRIGAIIGPVIGGILISWGLTMSSNFIIFSVPTIVAGVVTLFISLKES